MAKEKGPLHGLQVMLGHATSTMSMKYGQFADADLTELHRQLSPVEQWNGRNGAIKENGALGRGRRS